MTPRNPSRAPVRLVPDPQGPVRTCVGCGRRDSRSVLVRLVVSGGDVVIDGRKDMPGRGAYVHPDPACLKRAVERRTIGRALRSLNADVSTLDLASLGTPPIDNRKNGTKPR